MAQNRPGYLKTEMAIVVGGAKLLDSRSGTGLIGVM
jgi:hypothetical protein